MSGTKNRLSAIHQYEKTDLTSPTPWPFNRGRGGADLLGLDYINICSISDCCLITSGSNIKAAIFEVLASNALDSDFKFHWHLAGLLTGFCLEY